MKTIARLASLAVAVSLFAGCQTAAKKPMAAPAPMRSPEETLESVRTDLSVTAPTARFASVTEVDADDSWIALGSATPGDFPVGETVSVVDEQQAVIGHAVIKQSADGKVYAQFFKGTGRSAQVGDVAVRF